MIRTQFNDGWKYKRVTDQRGLNAGGWQDVTLPHDAMRFTERKENAYDGTKKGFFENGVWEYVKVFHADPAWKGKDVLLEFEGVYNKALVYLNGNFVGKNAYGYTEFTADLTEYLEFEKKNVLKVICTTGNDSRWYSGAGIYRPVNLFVADKVHIHPNGVRVTTVAADAKTAELAVSVKATGGEASFEVFGPAGEKVAESRDNTLFIRSPKLWSAETPALYTLKTTLWENGRAVDTEQTRFGIRMLSVSATEGLKVNGKQVRLRGACIHHDNGVIGATTLKAAEYRRVRILKKAGFNAIRSAHHPCSRALLDACDELGMYIMDEAFDMWHGPKSPEDYGVVFDEWWERDLAAMVEKDYNRPSVLMYSIGNEVGDCSSKEGVRTAKMLSDRLHQLDATRFTTNAINGIMLVMPIMEMMALTQEVPASPVGEEQQIKQPTGDVNETMAAHADRVKQVMLGPIMDGMIEGACNAVDISGYNYMDMRYARDKEVFPQRVIVGSETYLKDIASMWGYIRRNNNVIGDFTWTGWDYIGETGIGKIDYSGTHDRMQGFYGTYPWITAHCGDIDITGFRLPQSYYREIVFGLRTAPFIAVHRPETQGLAATPSPWAWDDVVSSWDFEGCEKTLTVFVYAGGEEVELFLNGKSLGRKPCGEETAFKAQYEVPFERGELKAVAYYGETCEETVLVTPEEETALSLAAEERFPECGSIVFVDVTLGDGSGNVRYGRDRAVRLAVEGGDLLGFGSGAPQTTECYTDDTHTTYEGRAFAVIARRAGEELHVRATSEGLAPAELHLKEDVS